MSFSLFRVRQVFSNWNVSPSEKFRKFLVTSLITSKTCRCQGKQFDNVRHWHWHVKINDFLKLCALFSCSEYCISPFFSYLSVGVLLCLSLPVCLTVCLSKSKQAKLIQISTCVLERVLERSAVVLPLLAEVSFLSLLGGYFFSLCWLLFCRLNR